MDHEELLDAINDLSPQAQCFLPANHLREAVDEGRIGSSLLLQAANHLRMLVDGGDAASRQ